jgi:hypothetical protein
MARISTEPTQLGAGVLDPFHPYGIAKRLKNKPIDHFAGTDTWLRVAAAEQDKLITLSWELGGMLVGAGCRDGGLHVTWQLLQQAQVAMQSAWPLSCTSTVRGAHHELQ